MKKIFLILVIASFIATASCGGKSTEEQAPADSIAASIIGKSIQIEGLLVAQNDFPNQMNWLAAQKACASLGPGWRLPTKDELNILYQSKDKIGGFFDHDFYWSSTEDGTGFTWCQQFSSGEQISLGTRPNDYHVRAVKSF